MQVRRIDLSHVVEPGMPMFPGLPSPVVTALVAREDSRRFYAGGTSFLLTFVTMPGNTGTYMDAPFHRFAGGDDLPDLPLERLAHVPAVVVRVNEPANRPVAGVDTFCPLGGQLQGRAVLVATGWDRHWGEPRYIERNPYLTAEAARFLRDEGVALVGIDSANIDDMADRTRPVHTILLEAGIPIVENLTGLTTLPERGAFLHAAPVKVRGGAAFPVRAYAVLLE